MSRICRCKIFGWITGGDWYNRKDLTRDLVPHFYAKFLAQVIMTSSGLR